MNPPKTLTIFGKEFSAAAIPLIEQSRKSIDIVIYDWRWYPDQIGSAIQKFNNAIISARKKGKRIRVISKSEQTLNVLKQNKVLIKKWSSKKNLHTKLMIIDEKIAIIGSHNYTMSAFTINYEVSLIIENETAVQQLNKYFQNLWQK